MLCVPGAGSHGRPSGAMLCVPAHTGDLQEPCRVSRLRRGTACGPRIFCCLFFVFSFFPPGSRPESARTLPCEPAHTGILQEPFCVSRLTRETFRSRAV